MSENTQRTPDETALVSQKFLETIHATMVALEMHPRLAVIMFGYFARRMVDVEADAGADRGEFTMALLQSFTEGLGVNSHFVKVDGEEAEQLRAEIERATDNTPLQ